MKNDNTEQVEIRKILKLDNLRNLVRAAFMFGQMKGLQGFLYDHEGTKDDREFFVSLITSKHVSD